MATGGVNHTLKEGDPVFRSTLEAVWWLLAVTSVASAGIACLSNPCQHGICIDDINSTHSCYCVDGYTGVECQTNWDECWSAPCQNGGTCIDGIASYNCTCAEGFIGDNCETNFNECQSNPCVNNGTCIDITNGYICSCIPGFIGDHCEVDIAVCNATEEVRCYNGGQCVEGPGFKFYCKCMPGWTGQKCEDDINECEPNPCQNDGFCIDGHADYMCACNYGFTGKNCEVQIEFCDKNSCSNNAICVIEDSEKVCYCVPDYHGEHCQYQYDECLLGPECKNGGTCIDGVDNFTCSCPHQLTGSLCECMILDDGTYDCDFVSPTPYSEASQSVFYTTSFESIRTTELAITTYVPGYNYTMPKTPSNVPEAWTSTTLSQETKDIGSETTTDLTTSATETVDMIETTTIKIDFTENQTEATLDTGDSKLETTTECRENCENITSTLSSTNITISTEYDTTTSLTTEFSTWQPPIEETTASPAIEAQTAEITKGIEVTTFKELPTTPKLGITTEKLFTDIPTDYGFSEITTLTPKLQEKDVTVTEDDVTDITTYASTTVVQSECTNSICNDRGTCINTPHGLRCHCNFNYGGKFCEDKISVITAAFGLNSYIVHKIQNTSFIDIEFNAKTLITDGQILHADIAKDIYMQLYMKSGLLKFKFSCGYQTMLLSELKTFVNKGYPMKIEARLDLYPKEQHCNATLQLNDTVAMSGGQVANISFLDQNTTLYLGNSPGLQSFEGKHFVGCLWDLMVNGEKRNVFGDAINAGEVTECSSLSCLSGPCHNGGSCSDYGDSYTCSCANGWIGEHCNQSVCEHNPCLSGGSCVRYPGSGFLCLCSYGKHGIFCEYNVEITQPSLAPISSGISSYLIYPLSQSAMNSDRFDLRLRFHTADMDQIALLLFVGQNGWHSSRSQHMALTFVKGYVMLTWNVGGGPRRVFTARALSTRRGGHAVRIWRRGRSAGISIDGRYNISGNAPAADNKMALLPYIFIGGHPSEGFRDLPHDLPLHSGWRGCVWEVAGQAVGSGKAIGGRGVGQCGVAQCTSTSCNAPKGVCIHSPATYGCICTDGWFGATCSSTKSPCDRSVSKCRGHCVITNKDSQCDCPYGKTGFNCDRDLIPTDVLFTGIRSFVQLYPRSLSSVSVSLEAEIKPAKERGLIIFAETPHFYTALSLQGGLLEYRWTDNLSGLTSLVRSGVVVSMSQWHKVKAGRYGSRLYVYVDGALSTEAMLAHAYPHTQANASIVIGGAKNLASLPFDAMSGPAESYFGCFRNLHVNNILLPLEKQNIQDGQNLDDCDGTPCGSETCGGNSCVVESGRASCACAGGSTSTNSGGRCRREAACSPAFCVYPGGSCRDGMCVCSTGFAGKDCDQRINITVPQFDGDAFLSPSRRNVGPNRNGIRQSGEQRLGSHGMPTFISVNFTTAEPQGLLIWTNLDTDYLGMGLENGYLKLTWLFQPNNSLEFFSGISTPPASRTLTRLVPHAGFLADAEWHTIVMRIERRNITVTVDSMLVYVEEPGFQTHNYYEDVDMFIGGVTERESSIAKKKFSHNFRGCIDHISTKEESYIENYIEMYSENVKSCQLFP